MRRRWYVAADWHLLRRPGGQRLVWQASSWARVDSIRGGVDLDVGRFR